MSSAELLAIGALAEATGTTVVTLRYYDELGLVPAATRVGGKRRFDRESIGRVNFVRRAQESGFSLDDVKAILDDNAGEWALLVETKLAELREQRNHLDEMIAMLDEVHACGCQVVAECPRLDGLC